MLEKDEIRSYTAGIIKTDIISEDVKLLENKSTIFSIFIKATVDTDVLAAKIKDIKADASRKKQMLALQAENDRLVQDLNTLVLQLKSTPSNAKKLIEERTSLYSKLDKNEKSIKLTFEKGTLFDLAIKNSDKLEQEMKDVDDFFQMLADNIKVELGKPEVRLVGDKADLKIDVAYKVDNIAEIRDLFNLKFSSGLTHCNGYGYEKSSDNFCISRAYNKYDGFGFTGINGDSIFNYFMSKRVSLVLKMGTITDEVDIASRNKTHLSDNVGGSDYYIKTAIWCGNKHDKPYFIIKNIPKEELKKIDSIDAKVIISIKKQINGIEIPLNQINYKDNVRDFVYYEVCKEEEAIIREKEIKKWNRKWKLRLIEEKNPKWRDLYDEIIQQVFA